MKTTNYGEMLISDLEALKAADRRRLNTVTEAKAEVARLKAENDALQLWSKRAYRWLAAYCRHSDVYQDAPECAKGGE